MSALLTERGKNPNRIPYFVVPLRDNSCSFVIQLLPGSTVKRIDFKVTVEGFVLRDQLFNSFGKLIDYFKGHCVKLLVRDIDNLLINYDCFSRAGLLAHLKLG